MILRDNDLRHLTPSHPNGFVDAPCPICSANRKPRNQRKPIFRVWYQDGRPTGFKCVHCGAAGGIIGGRTSQLACNSRRAVEPNKTEPALRIWREARYISGTPAENYLRNARRIDRKSWPDDLRYHPECPRGCERKPALIALMRDIRTNEPTGIHRTFITRDGMGKDGGADGDAKMMLGRATDAVVKLVPDAEITLGLGIGEGLETTLHCLAQGRPMWSCLSATGIAKFPVLVGIEVLTIYADHDQAGKMAAFECHARWVATGVEVHVLRPKIPGADFNDVLRAV